MKRSRALAAALGLAAALIALAAAALALTASSADAQDAPPAASTAAAPAAAPATAAEALEAFRRGDPRTAADTWRALALATPDNPDLWYDLGTAEARAGRPGPAIHALEQALLLRPGDDDAAHNLATVRARVVETALGGRSERRAVLPGEDDAGTGLLTALAPRALGITFAVAWVLLFALLHLARRAAHAGLRTAASFAAVVCGLVSLATGGLLIGRKMMIEDRLYGVVAEETAARQGPGDRYPQVIDVLPGVKVRLGGEEAGWRQVVLPDGGGAWIASEQVLPLRRP